jgi:hypothetical protein
MAMTTPASSSGPTEVPPPAPGWYRDPTGRHDKRLWNGFAWTSKVLTDDPFTPEPVAKNPAVVAASQDVELAPAEPRPSPTPDDSELPQPSTGRLHRMILLGAVVAVAIIAGIAAVTQGYI